MDSDNTLPKQDLRANNGGKRPGAGRPKGPEKDYKNKTIRVPKDLIEQAKEVGIVDGTFTDTFISGLKKEIKAKKRKK